MSKCGWPISPPPVKPWARSSLRDDAGSVSPCWKNWKLREGPKIALYFTGRQHAGENIAAVAQRAKAARKAPVCGSRSELSRGVLEMLGEVYRYDAEAREAGLTRRTEDRAQLRSRFREQTGGDRKSTPLNSSP